MPPAPTLALTGERTLPGIPDENYWYRRHEAAYAAVAPFTAGALVLEAGCGEGYGADLLARSGARVVGLDYDAVTASHVRRTYPSTVVAVRGDLQRLPLGHRSVEVVVCLQVIEHLWDQPGFVRECARVLRPAGTLVISTPNRLTFSPDTGPGERPLNPFHTRELSAAELTSLLDPVFTTSRCYGLTHGRRITRFERKHGSIVAAQIAGPTDSWPDAVRRFIPGVTVADFDVALDSPTHPIDRALDLVVVATRR